MATTDLDAAMQAGGKVSAQWQTVNELQRLGWKYDGLDASGRRVNMRRGNLQCRVDTDGQAKR